MKILIWGCWGVTNSYLIQFCISILKKNVCLKKGGGGHDSSAGLEAEGYSGKSAISPPPRSSRHGTTELLFLGPA